MKEYSVYYKMTGCITIMAESEEDARLKFFNEYEEEWHANVNQPTITEVEE